MIEEQLIVLIMTGVCSTLQGVIVDWMFVGRLVNVKARICI